MLGFVEHGDDVAVVASNAGLDRPPAWWLNLQEDPRAEIDLRGERRIVRARRAEGEESERIWCRVLEQFRGFESYDEYTQREISLVVLERFS